MYKIANEHAPDILKYNAALPPAFVAFLDKAMSKRPTSATKPAKNSHSSCAPPSAATGAVASGTGVDITL